MPSPDSPASKLVRRAQDVLAQLVEANDEWERAYRRLKDDSIKVEADLRTELRQARLELADGSRRSIDDGSGRAGAGSTHAAPSAIDTNDNSSTISTSNLGLDPARLLSQLGFSSPDSLAVYLTTHPLPPGGLPSLVSQAASTAKLTDALAAGLADAQAAWAGQEALERAVEGERERRWEADRALAGWRRRAEALEASVRAGETGAKDSTDGGQSRSPAGHPIVGSPSPTKKDPSRSGSSRPLTPSRKANLPCSPLPVHRPAYPPSSAPAPTPVAAPPTPPASLLLAQNASLREALRARQAKHRSDRRHWRTFTGKVVELYQKGKQGELIPGGGGGGGGKLSGKVPITAPAWESTNPFTSLGRPPPTIPTENGGGAANTPPPALSPQASAALAQAISRVSGSDSGLIVAGLPTDEPMAKDFERRLDVDANPFLAPTPRPTGGLSLGARQVQEVARTASPSQTGGAQAEGEAESRQEERVARPSMLASQRRPAQPPTLPGAASPPPLPTATDPAHIGTGTTGTGRVLVRASESVSSLTPLSSSPAGPDPPRSPGPVGAEAIGGENDDDDEDDVVGTSVPQERASYRYGAALDGGVLRPATSRARTVAAGRLGSTPLSEIDRRLLDTAERETERWERLKRSATVGAPVNAGKDDGDVFGAGAGAAGGAQPRQPGQSLSMPPPTPPPAKRRRIEADERGQPPVPGLSSETRPSQPLARDRTPTVAARRTGGQAEPPPHLPTPETAARPSATAIAKVCSKATPTAAQPNAVASGSRTSSTASRQGATAAGPTPTTEPAQRAGKQRWLGRHLFEETVRDGPPTPLGAAATGVLGGKRKLAIRDGDGELDVDIDTPVREGGFRPLAFGIERGSPAALTGVDDDVRRRKGKGRASDLTLAPVFSSSTATVKSEPLEPAGSIAAAAAGSFVANIPNGQIPLLVPDSPPLTRARPAWERTPSEELAEAARYRALEGPTKGMTAAERKAFNRSLRDKPAKEVAALFSKFKGRGRYAGEQQTDSDRTINQDFEIVPERNQGRDYAFDSVVRKRDDRRQMHGTDCDCCRGYYEAVGPLAALPSGPVWRRAALASPPPPPAADGPPRPTESTAERSRRERAEAIESHRQAVSRHREDFAVPQTPPQYFETGMFDDEQIDAINAEAGRRAADKRRRIELEAARGDGKYRRRRS